MDPSNRVHKQKSKELSPKKKAAPAKKYRNWDESYAALVVYREKFGNVNVPRRYKGDTALAKWVGRQRTYQRKLSSDQHQKLVALGFEFSISPANKWNTMFAELKKFKSMHGHCQVPQDSKRLGEWVHNQRTRYRQNLMDKDRQKKLESVGFEWKVRNQKLDRCTQTEDQKWLENYRKLVEIHQTHGHCSVGGVAHDKLRNWLENQRAFYSKNILRKDRQELLDEVGFEWNPTKDTSYQDMWNKNIANFLEYKRTHGGCTKVPYTYTKGGLGGWASNQSQIFRDGDMEAHRARLLLDEGFPYVTEESGSWKARYEQLKAFLSSSEFQVESEPSLLRWTRLQRVLRENNVLELSRIDLLNSIGFSWEEVGVNIAVT